MLKSRALASLLLILAVLLVIAGFGQLTSGHVGAFFPLFGTGCILLFYCIESGHFDDPNF